MFQFCSSLQRKFSNTLLSHGQWRVCYIIQFVIILEWTVGSYNTLINEPRIWLNFSTELEDINTLQKHLQAFNISFIPRGQNAISDSLSITGRSLHREVYFVGFFIPVSIFKPPLVLVIERKFDAKKNKSSPICHTNKFDYYNY